MERTKDIAQFIVVWTVVIAILVTVVLQGVLVHKLDQIIKADEAAAYVPEFDICDLHVIGCTEAAVIEVEQPEKVEAEALAEYLRSKGGDELAAYAEDILELDRWQDVVAIAWHETQFCTTGVGASQNNCGGIKSWKTERVFKHYNNVFDSVWDIAYLLNKPRFKSMSLADLNGIYCHDASTATGKCPNWTEAVTHISAEVAVVTSAN